MLAVSKPPTMRTDGRRRSRGEQERDGGVPGREPADDDVGSSHGPPGGERPGEWARLGVLAHVVAFREQVTVDHDEACRPAVGEEDAGQRGLVL